MSHEFSLSRSREKDGKQLILKTRLKRVSGIISRPLPFRSNHCVEAFMVIIVQNAGYHRRCSNVVIGPEESRYI